MIDDAMKAKIDAYYEQYGGREPDGQSDMEAHPERDRIHREKDLLGRRLQDVTFMEMALFLFVLEVVLFLGGACVGDRQRRQCALAGQSDRDPDPAAGVPACLVTLYGHYTVEAESQVDWRIGIYTNGGWLGVC